MDSILHSAEGVVGGEDASPANLEELQLIEEHLRYNANVYNSHSSRSDLRIFAKIPDVDVDFEGEMERVLDTLRITELVKRNLKNRGLQGKELKAFDTLVKKFQDSVVEDLVLVKKDMMEIRMRRAGYLRYTNKTAYCIVEDRYTEKDWKTGERITSSSSDSSGTTLLSEDVITPLQYVTCHKRIHANADFPRSATPENPLLPVCSSPGGADRRHLQHVHTRISGDDGLAQRVIEPYHTPLLSLVPNTPLKKPAVLQLKVNENKENKTPADTINCGWLRKDVTRQTRRRSLRTAAEEKEVLLPSSLSVKPVALNETRPATQPAWSNIRSLMQDSMTTCARAEKKEFPALGSHTITAKPFSTRFDAPVVQRPAISNNSSATGPEAMVTLEDKVDATHPVVSQKKAKKAQREAKRKAKKVSDPEDTCSPAVMMTNASEVIEQGLCSTLLDSSLVDNRHHAVGGILPQSSDCFSLEKVDDAQAGTPVTITVTQNTGSDVSNETTSPMIPHTTHGKHGHWTRFSRFFIVDQLTIPLLQSFEGCSHGSSCLFESHGVLDCPFHEPREFQPPSPSKSGIPRLTSTDCSCIDPLLNQCYLMHPGKELCTSGPYNKAQGERLLAMYEQHGLTKGRVMLVDGDLVPYLMENNGNPTKPNVTSMPSRLLREHTEFLDGYDCGPLMKQEAEFERLFVKNMSMRHALTTSTLQDIQRQHLGPKGSSQLCFCKTEVLLKASNIAMEFSKGFVRCSFRKCEFGGIFHKRCVKKLGFEKVSRWYCTACEKQMKALSCKTLNIAYTDNTLMMVGLEEQLREKVIANMFAKPVATMKHISSRLPGLYAGEMRGDLKVEDVD